MSNCVHCVKYIAALLLCSNESFQQEAISIYPKAIVSQNTRYNVQCCCADTDFGYFRQHFAV